MTLHQVNRFQSSMKSPSLLIKRSVEYTVILIAQTVGLITEIMNSEITSV